MDAVATPPWLETADDGIAGAFMDNAATQAIERIADTPGPLKAKACWEEAAEQIVKAAAACKKKAAEVYAADQPADDVPPRKQMTGRDTGHGQANDLTHVGEFSTRDLKSRVMGMAARVGQVRPSPSRAAPSASAAPDPPPMFPSLGKVAFGAAVASDPKSPFSERSKIPEREHDDSELFRPTNRCACLHLKNDTDAEFEQTRWPGRWSDTDEDCLSPRHVESAFHSRPGTPSPMPKTAPARGFGFALGWDEPTTLVSAAPSKWRPWMPLANDTSPPGLEEELGTERGEAENTDPEEIDQAEDQLMEVRAHHYTMHEHEPTSTSQPVGTHSERPATLLSWRALTPPHQDHARARAAARRQRAGKGRRRNTGKGCRGGRPAVRGTVCLESIACLSASHG